MSNHNDYEYMARAIQLAKRGHYTTDPNPKVGCVLVNKGEIVAEGWHAWAGKGHAEIEALKKTTDTVAATAYVTLEPCSHFGKTPPCCDALISAGITRVVVAMQDPNPRVSGTGIARLRAAGIRVDCGILESDARDLNPGFIKRMQTGLPRVVSKVAMSMDGRTALASGESKWITSAASRKDVHKMRASSSAVLTGINTVLADDPGLDARLHEDVDVLQPTRIVLDSKLQMPVDAKMLKLPGQCLILTCANNPDKKHQLEQKGCQVIQLSAGKKSSVDLVKVFRLLGDMEINDVLVEAGAILNGALLEQKLVDQWVVFMAPIILGDKGRGVFNLPAMQTMAEKKAIVFADVRKIGPDLKLKLLPGE